MVVTSRIRWSRDQSGNSDPVPQEGLNGCLMRVLCGNGQKGQVDQVLVTSII